MVWSVISGKGYSCLYFLQGTMKQDQYITLLKNRLIPQVKEWFPNDEDFVFMQYEAPCHTAKRVKEFSSPEKHQALATTRNSPDLNPTENIWELVKREIAKETITTKRRLIELIQVWYHNPRIQKNDSLVLKVCYGK